VKSYYVYVMSGRTRALYIGVTNDLARRVYEHKNKLLQGFTSKYKFDRLVNFKEGRDIAGAIEREKELPSQEAGV
jgi:putative endonuclease